MKTGSANLYKFIAGGGATGPGPPVGGKDLPTMVHALVTPRLDYCNTLIVEQPLKITQKLQAIQNSAARMLTEVGL